MKEKTENQIKKEDKRKQQRTFPVGYTVLLAVIVVAQIFLVIGKQGYVNPVIAGLAPTVAFIAYGLDRVLRNQA